MFSSVYQSLQQGYQQSGFKFLFRHTALAKLLAQDEKPSPSNFFSTYLSSWWWNRLWFRFCIKNQAHRKHFDNLLQSFQSSMSKDVDFSLTIEGDQCHPSSSYANIYAIPAARKWKWLRNLIHLKKWSNLNPDENPEAILAQFSNKEEDLVDTDLSFARNRLQLIRGDTYINLSAFEEYLAHLASYRHYHLFAQVLFCILKMNSVATLDILKNLLHARDQLNKQGFFDADFSMLYIQNKSQQWISSLIYRILPKNPINIVRIEAHSDSILESLDNQNILLCDDICYTGTQICNILDSLAYQNKEIKITLLFARMSIYALSIVAQKIDEIKRRNSKFQANIVAGELFHTLSAQLDFLPFPPTKKERHIIKQILEADFSAAYHSGDFRRRPLLTTAWKRPDYVSSYYKFIGFDGHGPDLSLISSALLTNPPRSSISFFTAANPAPNMKIAQALISGPSLSPYKN